MLNHMDFYLIFTCSIIICIQVLIPVLICEKAGACHPLLTFLISFTEQMLNKYLFSD